jgi:hypothetical protein
METIRIEKNVKEMEKELRLQKALSSDPSVKAWIGANAPLFRNSEKNADLFLTTYRIRNAYEILLNKLTEGEEVTEEKDMILVQRLFDMDFYPPKKLSLSAWKEGKDPHVKILRAYKARRNKGNRRRSHEINLELSDGKTYQINPSDIMNKFFHIKNTIDSLINSNL